jgi:hypothetical protein
MEKNGSIQWDRHFKKLYNSVRIEVQYKILIEFGMLSGNVKIKIYKTIILLFVLYVC